MRSGCVVICVLLAAAFCISWKRSLIGLKDAPMLAGRGLVLLAICTWMIYMFQKLRSFFPVHQEPPSSPLHESSRLKQERVRIIQQNTHNEKTSEHVEGIIKPRQNLLLQQKIQRYYRMTGETWKLGHGYTVGEEETETHDDIDVNETPNQGAKRKRRLPQTVDEGPTQRKAHKPRKVVILPDEPLEDAVGVIKIALRCPSGRTVQRRFLKTWSSLILNDWMKKSGYHPAVYTLCMSYPRKPLFTAAELSLQQAGIDMDTVLNVEEKDPPTT